MKAKLETKATITLELNTHEAQWLHYMTQNSLLKEKETKDNQTIREDFFHNTDPTNFTEGS